MEPLASALAGLTDEQRAAVLSDAPALCVLAGAGSGKTRVLTLRVARRIAAGTAAAEHTVVCTFTRRAAGELRTRLGAFGVPASTPTTTGGIPGPGVRAATLHQLALSLVRRHAADAGGRPPRVVEARTRLLIDAGAPAPVAAAVADEIGWAKARGLNPEEYGPAARAAGRTVGTDPDEVARHFAAYDATLARRDALDLDDLPLRAAGLIEADAAFAAAVRWRYRHVAVDEYQDLNPAQFRLLRAILGEGDDLCAVGDPAQAIYGFNGADPGLLARLPSLYPSMEVVRLRRNHRSTPQVVAVANAVLAEGGSRGLSVGADGPLPTLAAFPDDRAEAEAVVDRLLAWSSAGRPFGRMAVLARTNDQLGVVAAALRAAGIPFRASTDGGRPDTTAPGRHAPGPGDDAGERVDLATFHRAKGLEWASVCVVGLEAGLVPISHATTADSLAEERRLLYVR